MEEMKQEYAWRRMVIAIIIVGITLTIIAVASMLAWVLQETGSIEKKASPSVKHVIAPTATPTVPVYGHGVSMPVGTYGTPYTVDASIDGIPASVNIVPLEGKVLSKNGTEYLILRLSLSGKGALFAPYIQATDENGNALDHTNLVTGVDKPLYPLEVNSPYVTIDHEYIADYAIIIQPNTLHVLFSYTVQGMSEALWDLPVLR